MAPPTRETELYGPLRDHLLALGYTVRGEVRGCDLTATRGDELLIIEMKLQLNLQLLVQATRRQQLADSVYVAVPRPSRRQRISGVRHLLRRLELGLIFVTLDSPVPRVEVVFHPGPLQRRRSTRERRALLQEMAGRPVDRNQGGSTRRKLVTAYRECSIFIATCLAERGPLAPRQLRALGTGPRTTAILAANHYGWFEHLDRGLYGLAPAGHNALVEHAELAEPYRAGLRPAD